MGDSKKATPTPPDPPGKCKELPAATDKEHKLCVKRDPALVVKLRTAFIILPSKTDRFVPGEGVAHALFELDGAAVAKVETKVTKSEKGLLAGKEVGFAKLPLAGVTDGEHKLLITHAANKKSLDVAGPDTKDTNQRLYRPAEVTLTLEGGKLKDAKLATKATYVSVVDFTEDELALDLKPDWIGYHSNRKRTAPISLVVVHHTGGEVIGGAINQVSGRNLGPHYEIDKDGHVIKFVEDDHVANHAAPAQWQGKDGVNEFSIGIEVVHEKDQFAQAQYDALIVLLNKLVTAHHLPARQIVSHTDVVKDHEGLRHRPEDPGLDFDWTKLEAQGLSMNLGDAPELDKIYDGFFAKGKTLPPVPAKGAEKVIEEAGQDLQALGYYVSDTSDFDSIRPAIYQFYQHFFARTRPHAQPKKFGVSGTAVDVLMDGTMATRLKQAVAGLPPAASPSALTK